MKTRVSRSMLAGVFYGLIMSFVVMPGVPAKAQSSTESLPDCTDGWKNTDPQFNFKESYENYYNRTQRGTCRKDWTVLVFMEADNDLFPYANWNLWEMEAGTTDSVTRTASTPMLDLLVEAEGPQSLPTGQTSNSLRRLHMFSQQDTGPTSPWRFTSQKTVNDFSNLTLDNVKSPVVEKLAASPMDNEGDRLKDFLLWGQKKYPAHHYMVIIWGHGEGWGALTSSSSGNFLTSGGLAYRDSTGSWLSILDLQKALKQFTVANQAPIDLFVTDACLMQMLEVDYQIADDAKYVLGTTQIQANQGLPYRNIFIQMNTRDFWGGTDKYKDTDIEADEPLLTAMMIPHMMLNSVAKRITYNDDGSPHVYVGYHHSDEDTYKSTSSSAVSSHSLSNFLIPTLRSLEGHIEAYLTEFRVHSPRRIQRIKNLRTLLGQVPLIEGGSQDFGAFLGMFYSLLAQEKQAHGGELTVQAEMLVEDLTSAKSDLDHAVTSFAYGDGYGFDPMASVNESRRGVSLWLPTDAQGYALRRAEFETSNFYQTTGWATWLDLVFAPL